MIDWVEHGKAPRTLDGVIRTQAGAITATRPICLFPEVAVYKGKGDPTDGSNFACRGGKDPK